MADRRAATWGEKFIMRGSRGFSLIELLIVIAILLVVAALAVPSLLQSRIAAAEAAAVGSLHAVNTAQTTYNSAYPEVGYASSLSLLGPGAGVISSTSAGLLDSDLGCPSTRCTKLGYSFALSGNAISYAAYGQPVLEDVSGRRSFYTDQTNVMHYNLTGVVPTTEDSILQ